MHFLHNTKMTLHHLCIIVLKIVGVISVDNYMLFICHTQGLGVTKPKKHDHNLSQRNSYFLEKFFEQIVMVSQNGALCASVS